MIRPAFLGLVIAALAFAQDTKVTVPLSTPSQPATLKVNVVNGSITVTAGAAGQIVIDSESRSSRRIEREERSAPAGMHRIDTGGRGFNAVEDHNVVTISPEMGGINGTNFNIQVPVNTSVVLGSVNGGHVDVTGLSGELTVQNVNASITLKDVSGSVVANTVNGALTVNLDRVTPNKPMSFTTLNGKIDVTLPADTKANLRLKTIRGAVYSDFDVKMQPDTSKPVIEDSRGKGGKYEIKMDHSVTGSINGGGPEYSFESMNGTILIHKK